MVDLFEEVEEQLRSDRYQSLARRVAPWITGIFAVVLIGYLGFWGFKFFEDRNLATATSEYQKGIDALSQNDSAGAFGHFQAAAKSSQPAYKSMALMQEGGLRLAAGKSDDAARYFDEAAKAAPNPVFGDLARLRAAQALLDTAPYPQLQTRLAPLADTKRPYSLYARESLAMAKLMAGKTREARTDFRDLSTTFGAPQDMVQRAGMAVALIDSGEVQTAVAAVKAANKNSATMPPPAAPNVAPPPPGADGQGGNPQAPAGAAQ